MATEKKLADRRHGIVSPWVFSGLFGAFLGLALLKFGNPPIMEKFIEPPTNLTEWIIMSWPVGVGYWLLGVVAVVGLFAGHGQTGAPKWVLALPLLWLGWQFVSATHSVDPDLTRATLKHFVACVVCFYLGVFGLRRDQSVCALWGVIVFALGIVLAIGLDQHFGGLADTRKYFFTYVYPQLPTVPPEYLKKISSDRIFSTLFYPNALAGVILLLLPPATVMICQCGVRLTTAARGLLVGLFGAAALACLYWSGSKGGWLLALLLALVALLHLPWSKRAKAIFVSAVLVAGMAGFFLKYAGFFQRGATSVSARFDYWRAALRTVAAKPVFGTGPGTFSIAYEAIKRPESEMSRLTHNDYLQQASDSGLVAAVAYLAIAVTILIHGYAKPATPDGLGKFAVWLGLLGYALQGLMEFGLYIPALAWTAFGVGGWLLGNGAKRFDNRLAGH
jgi:O-antigen ligase